MVIVLSVFNIDLGHEIHHAWARVALRIIGARVEYERDDLLTVYPTAVLAPNHSSIFDILVLAALPYDFKWISKSEVGKVPFLGRAMTAMGFYFVKRDRSSRDLNTMTAVEAGLRAGVPVAIFPEGTRSLSGELLPFKKGAFRTAQNAQVPILPIAILGTNQIAPQGKLPPRWGHRIVVKFGKPLTIPPNVPLDPYIDLCRQEILNLLQEGIEIPR